MPEGFVIVVLDPDVSSDRVLDLLSRIERRHGALALVETLSAIERLSAPVPERRLPLPLLDLPLIPPAPVLFRIDPSVSRYRRRRPIVFSRRAFLNVPAKPNFKRDRSKRGRR